MNSINLAVAARSLKTGSVIVGCADSPEGLALALRDGIERAGWQEQEKADLNGALMLLSYLASLSDKTRVEGMNGSVQVIFWEIKP